MRYTTVWWRTYFQNITASFCFGQSIINGWDLKFRGRIICLTEVDCKYLIPLCRFHLIVRVLEIDTPVTFLNGLCLKLFKCFQLSILIYSCLLHFLICRNFRSLGFFSSAFYLSPFPTKAVMQVFFVFLSRFKDECQSSDYFLRSFPGDFPIGGGINASQAQW